jgi:[protein-PII] uridylyltransferase
MTYSRSTVPVDASDEVLLWLDKELGSQLLLPGDARTLLEKGSSRLEACFQAGEPVARLVHLRAQLVDRILTALWQHVAPQLAEEVALVAVGGFGRGELHPWSDVDIMLLLPEALPEGGESALSDFVTVLWDVGLEIGQSVRTLSECHAQAGADITVATTLMESRLICGPQTLFDAMIETTGPDKLWSSAEFFEAKREEQRARHKRYDDTAYKLEPNVKGSPGGLRDIQMIGWVTKRHFGAQTLDELVDHHFLTPGQLRILNDGQTFLWRVRFALHILTGRREDRLLFDHQVRLATMLGYEDASYTLGVEQMMQRYYRTVMDLSRLNEMLLQQFEEAILMDPAAAPQPLNERFQAKNGYLQTTHADVFRQDPSALLELFLLLQSTDLRGVSAYTVGQIKRNLYLIDEEFRQNPRNHRLFLSILRASAGVTHELRRMNMYGVLGLYVPAFGRIVGRMQYDLFHAYTVDEHILFVVSNLRRFALSRFNHEFPHCSPLMQSFEKPEIVYLAGLFHDIAKGRGGDHSKLGAVDAEAFCLEHGLGKYDSRTVAWLVRNHLALSTTAQKKDISDPDVVNEFAALVGDQTHLDYLYVLTVADIRATSPTLWNSWKATLLRDLYDLTSRALRRGLENPIDREELIKETQTAAALSLANSGVSDQDVAVIWRLLTEDYFLRYRAEEIAWHTEVLADSDLETDHGLVELRKQPHGDGIEALLYTPRAKRTFAHATGILDQLGLTIVDARIVPIGNGYSLDTYVVMELDSRIEIDAARISKIRRSLARVLTTADDNAARVTRTVSRQAKVFSTKHSVSFSQDNAKRRTVMELVAADHPGLLSTVGQVFIEQHIDMETAKIHTVGERAEDVFYISDQNGVPLGKEACAVLRERLIERLE